MSHPAWKQLEKVDISLPCFSSRQAFSELDEADPHLEGQSALLRL